ncbi:OmpA family protein [Propionivibrio dicarboxylicus]|uniref:Outer membrane protein OmpA n=1 Tax=Propionivibrio dicarboxylicus TaxID=83767 RepID=A0A1G7W2P4_9RHOO|nr:OmpA family protein [Propionivibrio dicarboxylicus]SDG66285.1 Outer membrane protein OmpA [Propionivibrio dicarboxylicus]
MYANKLITAALLLAFGLATGSAVAADVKVYDKAPSVEELQRQLTGSDEGAPRSKPRTRAIVFGDAAPAPQEAAPPQAAPAPAPAPQAQAPRPQQTQSQGQAQAARPQPQQQSVQVGTNAIAFPINFRVNSSDIMPESIPFLESIAGLMQKDPGVRLMVEGHTDSSGSSARNNSLSRERAYSVVNYLIDHYRIDPTRLMPVGKGFSEPLEGLDASNPKNRRVQFRIIG